MNHKLYIYFIEYINHDIHEQNAELLSTTKNMNSPPIK